MLWKEFIRSHLETLAAGDFFTAEVWTAVGLMTYYALVFMRIAPRQVSIAGITLAPDGEWHYARHYHEERNHQGKDNLIPFPVEADRIGSAAGKIQTRERLGGLLKFYHRAAA